MADDLGVGEDVVMPGDVRNPFSFMSRASVFGLTSLSESIPMVLVEALALGTRVVSTPCSQTAIGFLSDGSAGTLVPFGDANTVAKALGRELDRSSEPMPRLDVARFTVGVAVKKYLDVAAAP
jgi:glycosyltransferase involved in cell wall biosynthesis